MGQTDAAVGWAHVHRIPGQVRTQPHHLSKRTESGQNEHPLGSRGGVGLMLCANSGHRGSWTNDGSTGGAVAGDHVTAELMYAAGHGAANLQWKNISEWPKFINSH